MGWKSAMILIVGTCLFLTYIGVLPLNNILPQSQPYYGVPYSNLGYRNITAETYLMLKR